VEQKKKENYRQNDLETNSKNENIRGLHRGISYFKKGYQPKTDLVKGENGELLEDSPNILNRPKKTSVSY
jgi:hypothetical protein